MVPMADIRRCEQCGTSFVPLREHARFCSARCRVAWNRQDASTQACGESALDWSGTAMRDAADRVLRASAPSLPQGFVMISEAVWWVTIVDATLVRWHPDPYSAVLAGRPGEERELIEGTLAGLRFVRNWMGYHADHADFIRPHPRRPGPGGGPIAAWRWRSLPTPAVRSFPPLRQEWEMDRYQAYQSHLAGQTVAEVFGRAAAFLTQASVRAAVSLVAERP
jgi:hypothetical protein